MMLLTPLNFKQWGEVMIMTLRMFFLNRLKLCQWTLLADSTWFLADFCQFFTNPPMFVHDFMISNHWLPTCHQPTWNHPIPTTHRVSQQTHEDRHCMFPVRILELTTTSLGSCFLDLPFWMSNSSVTGCQFTIPLGFKWHPLEGAGICNMYIYIYTYIYHIHISYYTCCIHPNYPPVN